MNTQLAALLLFLAFLGYALLGPGLSHVSGFIAKQGNQTLTIGNKDAPIAVVHFVDYLNAGSQRIHQNLTQLRARHPETKIIVRPLPNKQNPASVQLAKLVLAHKKTGYALAVHDALMRQPVSALNTQIDTVLQRIDPENVLPPINLDTDPLYVDLFWDRTLANMAGIKRAPGIILGPEVIDHDAHSVFNLSQMVSNL